MGNLHLVTGYAGVEHVTAADHASLHAALFGEGEYVLNRGSKFESSIISNNQIRIADGDLLMQGRHIRLNEGSYEDLPVENGQQGMNRNDLVVARYTKDSVTGVEGCNLVVIKGAASADAAADPEYTVGSIIHDDVLVADMPLYRIRVVGLSVAEVVPLFEVFQSIEERNDELDAKIEDSIKMKTATVTLSASGWSSKSQKVNVTGATANNTIICSPAPASYTVYHGNNVRCSAQGSGTLTFTCDTVPTSALTVNVMILTQGVG